MSSPPLGKYLASSDKKTRDNAVKHLALFLSSPENNALSEVEIAKLWKGLFYCELAFYVGVSFLTLVTGFWMSDKPRVQQDLAQELAELLLTITSISSSLAFLKGFWNTIVREWNGIDRLRMDKYYMLVRRFLNASFRLLIRAEWNSSALQEYSSTLISRGGPLCPADVRVPTGLTFHLAEIYFEELEKALSTSGSSTPVPVLALLSPFISLAARTQTIATYRHLEESLLKPLLATLRPRTSSPHKRARGSAFEYSKVLSNACADVPHTDGPMLHSALREAILQKLFAVASADDTRDANRKKLYALYRTAMAEDEDSIG